MSKVGNTQSAPAARKSAPTAKSAPAASKASQPKENQGPGKSKQSKGCKDQFQASSELKDSQKCAKNSEQEKGGDKKCKGELGDKVKELDKQLQELRQSQNKAATDSSSSSCGGGGEQSSSPAASCAGAQEAGSQQPSEPNQELQGLAVAVFIAQQSQGNGQGPGQPGPSGGQQGQGEVVPLQQKLASRCQQLKGSGFQPKPETRQLVAAAVGGDLFGGGPSGPGACGQHGQHGQQVRPAQASPFGRPAPFGASPQGAQASTQSTLTLGLVARLAG